MTSPKKKRTGPNKRWDLVIDGLISGLDGISAYEKAGYKARGKAASSCMTKLLDNAVFASRLAQRRKEIQYKADVKAVRILEEEKCIAYQDIRRIFNGPTLIPPQELPEDVARAVSAIKVTQRTIPGNAEGEQPVVETVYEYKFWDKGRSLERLEKIEGMFEKDNKQAASAINIYTDIGEKDDSEYGAG